MIYLRGVRATWTLRGLHRYYARINAGISLWYSPSSITHFKSPSTHSKMFSLASLTLFISAFISTALATTVSYDRIYDNSAANLNTVACSDGPHGLMRLGYTTFGSLPDYPYIGGSSDVVAWDSPSCTFHASSRFPCPC